MSDRSSRCTAAWRAVIGLCCLVLLSSACAGTGDTVATQSETTVSVTTEVTPLSPTGAPSSTTTGGVVAEPATTTQPPTAPTTTSTSGAWADYDRLNILLLGSDAGVGRIGTRTDTIILVSVETRTGDAVMISIPRNLTEAPLPEGMGVWDCNCFPDILTHLWANGEWYPDAFPGPQAPSVNALKAAVGLIFGEDIHYYALVDLAGFVDMIDAIGGVTIDAPKRIVDESYPHENGGTEGVVIEEGLQTLDGHLALAYGRIRRHSGDFARMHRQRCLIGAIIEGTELDDVVAGGKDLVAAFFEHVETDIPLDRLGDFLELFSLVDLDRLATLRITSYNYGASGHAGYQLYDLESIRADAHTLMADPTAQLATQDGAGFAATCEQSFD